MTVVLVNQAMADGMDEVFGARDDIECRVVEDQTESALLRHIPGVHGLVLGLAPMTPHVIEAAAGALKVVSRRGVGYDNVDLAALTRAGIPLTVVGSANSVSVAEHTLHLMLALAKQSHVQDARLRRASWNDARLVRPVDLAGRRVLVLGLGRIGGGIIDETASDACSSAGCWQWTWRCWCTIPSWTRPRSPPPAQPRQPTGARRCRRSTS